MKGRGGYTIVEVLLVIAVSTLLFLAALKVFSGQKGETQFTQAMQDLRSKLQSAVVEVTSGVPPETSGYGCSISPINYRPVFTAGSSNNQECIFLGKAILVTPGTNTADTVYIYSVWGSHYQQPGNTEPATSLNQANPEIAHDATTPTPSYLFNDSYTLIGGAQVVHASSYNGSASLGRSDLAGFYTALNATAASTTSESPPELAAKAYTNSAALNPPADVATCIEGNIPCSGALDATSWNVCIQSGYTTKRTALLTADVTSTGVKIRIEYKDCT